MSRYIDAEQVLHIIRQLQKGAKKHFDERGTIEHLGYACGLGTAAELMENAELEDVAPVIHAHWLPIESAVHVEKSGACSNCGEAWIITDTTYFYYCPNCGAKMDDEVDNG